MSETLDKKYLIRPEWKIARGYFYASTGELFDDETCDNLEEITRKWLESLEDYNRIVNSKDPYKLKVEFGVLATRPGLPITRDLDKDLIKETVLLSTVINSYTRVIPTSGHTFKASCPFHKDRTPSLSVNNDKNVWHCFGCSQGGDVFTFLMLIEKCSFPEAVQLANNYI